jgi:hypothetical protein
VACKQDPRGFLELVSALAGFAEDFPRQHTWEALLEETDPRSLPFEALEIPHEEPCAASAQTSGTTDVVPLCVPGIIGLGITTALLHYREAALLPWRSRFALTGLFFLSGQYSGTLETSEFVLWDPQRGGCYSNYTYHYAPFYFHVARVAALLHEAAESLGVIAGDFLRFVADENLDVTKDWAPESDAGGFLA